MAGINDCDRGSNNPAGSNGQSEPFECPFCEAEIKRYHAHLPNCEDAP